MRTSATTHGTNGCYTTGRCRCDACKLAHKISQSQWLRRAAAGPRIVDSKAVMAAVSYARKAGITWRDISSLARCPQRSLDNMGDRIHVNTRKRLLAAITQLLSERQAALEDAWSALRFAADSDEDAGRWSTAQLREVIDRRWPMEDREAPQMGLKTLLSVEDRRYIYRSEHMDDTRAERVCAALGLLPEDVWPAWFGIEDAS